MNYPLTYSGQVRTAAAGLAEVADRHGRVTVISRSAGGTAALLDQAAHELSGRRIRCVRVQGLASGGLALRGLIAQLTGQPDPGALTDSDLKAGFMALTEPGQGYDRVALLVAEAHSLLPSAVRYIQLACQSSPTKLAVVLAGQPSLSAVLAGDELAYLRGAMHVMELPEPARQSLFDQTLAVPEPRAMPAVSRRNDSSPLVRLGLAALIIPIVGLIWWRHLPAAPATDVPSQDAPSVPSVMDAPAAPRAVEPASAEPDPVAVPQTGAVPQAGAGLPATDPAPSDPAPEPPVSEPPAKPEAPADSSAAEATEPPAAAEQPALATAPERSEPPSRDADLAETPAPLAAPATDAAPPVPDPAVPDPPAAKPPAPLPNGTLTVTTALPARGGARRVAPLAAPPTAARAVEDRPSVAEEYRCRDIVLKAQLGKDPSDADTQFLRNGCRGG